ncbi:polysaccharide pyruvyl transferase family protein [Clostridium vincentii]|uniref:Polysaccharide pyruvyl transferase n=1 Tax=Clostridium vincentii TaxID=52704 RepID=A0A2T0BJQ9_9CLOT|nr:polysaccharide pyruvyl transferase family protein [Clostridium vincentii]PRR84087.1 Polysaccharide pyruvyl transferase [Clostridium vincentii]
MKIKTITCHFVHNYGAILQAYALSKHISNILPDSEVEIIDYRPPYLENPHKIFNVGDSRYRKNIVLKTLYRVRVFPYRYATTKNFKDFIKKYLPLTDNRYHTYKELLNNPPIADKYICGSDQIWNYREENGKDPAFYLNFVKTGKKIAYAPSFAVSEINEDETNMVKRYLKDFKDLSIREQAGVEILNSLGYKNVPRVIDPVYLLNASEWREIESPLSYKDYILIYKIENNNAIYECARKLARKHNLKIIEVGFSAKIDVDIDKYLCGVSPSEFLYLLDNARYVVTNSFHGVSFSIIFEKQFITIKRSKTNSRIEGILKICNLENRTYDENNDINEFEDIINYSEVNDGLQKEINYSREYLMKVLK